MLVWTAQIIKTAACIAIVLIVALRLTNIQVDTENTQITYSCLLGTNTSYNGGGSLCTYAYIGEEGREATVK